MHRDFGRVGENTILVVENSRGDDHLSLLYREDGCGGYAPHSSNHLKTANRRGAVSSTQPLALSVESRLTKENHIQVNVPEPQDEYAVLIK